MLWAVVHPSLILLISLLKENVLESDAAPFYLYLLFDFIVYNLVVFDNFSLQPGDPNIWHLSYIIS